MATFLSAIQKIIAAVMSLVSFLATQGPVTFSPLDAQTVRLNFAIVADTHFDEIWNDGGRSDIMVKGLNDMAKAEIKSDAFIIAGDMTEKGTMNEYIKLGTVLKQYCKADNLLLEMGNHDIRGIKDANGNSIWTYQYSAAKYFELLDKAANIQTDTIYYYKVIKGCWFIVLNPEEAKGMETVLSEAQLQWLDGVLAQAQTTGNPAFIINHQPLPSVGEQREQLTAVLQKYNGAMNIFFITGHYHNGFSSDSITNKGTLYFVDTPAYGKTNGGDYTKTGSGFQVELYDNSIVFRTRNFAEGVWVPGYDRTITLMNENS